MRENLVQTSDICICLAIFLSSISGTSLVNSEIRNARRSNFSPETVAPISRIGSLSFLFARFVIPRTISQICPHAIEANVNRLLRIAQTIILFVLTRDALFPLSDIVVMKVFLGSHQSISVVQGRLGALQVAETCRGTRLPVWCKYRISLRRENSRIKNRRLSDANR